MKIVPLISSSQGMVIEKSRNGVAPSPFNIIGKDWWTNAPTKCFKSMQHYKRNLEDNFVLGYMLCFE